MWCHLDIVHRHRNTADLGRLMAQRRRSETHLASEY